MNSIKIISTVSFLLLLSLFALVITVDNPIEKKYEETVHKIMAEQNYSNKNQVLKHFPEMVDIKAQIKKMKQWQYELRQNSQNPLGSSPSESQYIQEKISQVKALKKAIQRRLQQMDTRFKSKSIQFIAFLQNS